MRATSWCLALLMASGIALQGDGARGDDKDIPVNQLPKAVVNGLKKRFPTGQLLRAARDAQDEKSDFTVNIKVQGKSIDVAVTPSGVIEGMEMEIAPKDLPKLAKESLSKKFAKAVPRKVVAVFGHKNGKDIFQLFQVSLETPDKQTVDVAIGADGQIKSDDPGADENRWTRDFSTDKDSLASTGRNPYFVLEPGYQLVLEEKKEQLTITVLEQTKTIAGVETRVVEERNTKNGELAEVSRSYYAISKRTNSVYCFGADTDTYKDKKVAGHDGSWLAGASGATPGLAMPGLPLLGARFYESVAPEAALDRAHIVGIAKTVKVPAGEFKDCWAIEETTPLDPSVKEIKLYAAGVGRVQDGSLKLVRHGQAPPAKK